MAYVTKRKNVKNEVLLLLPLPLFTGTRTYYEEDLEEMGLGNVLDDYPEEVRIAILQQAGILSSVRPELAFHFLRTFPDLLKRLPLNDLGKWVGIVLDLYDREGVNPARDFILRTENHPLFVLRWGKGIAFDQVQGVLSGYLGGLGREEIRLAAGRNLHTDFTSIYLPERVHLFVENESNFLLYKIMITHKFAQIRLGSFFLRQERLKDLEEVLTRLKHLALRRQPLSKLSAFFDLFPEPRLAMDLYVLADAIRVEEWLSRELPGLFRDLGRLKGEMASRRSKEGSLTPKSRVMDLLFSWWLSGEIGGAADSGVSGVAREIADSFISLMHQPRETEEIAILVAKAHETIYSLPGPYGNVQGLPYVGEFRPDEAERGRRRRRVSLRRQFREELSSLAQELPEPQEVRFELPPLEDDKGSEIGNGVKQTVPREVLMNGNPIPVPEGLQKIISEIYEDLGSIPGSYLTVTNEMSGHHFRPLVKYPEPSPVQSQGAAFAFSENGSGVHAFDEWDFRRQGYRKKWALLRETAAEEGGMQFAEEMLERYSGMVRRLKNQFELIRTGRALLRRQKEGDEVDLDAAVEAVHDRKAGRHPSDRLFVRMSREERDIATAFLIDLSGSTSGWINDMERTALLIMSEAVQVLQDRFAIYGFSGRTRKRCELFRIKGFDEPYGEMIKRRISNLRALEYTRLGPPIRFITGVLTRLEARTRLLITLSDGKPDDYDGYNGDYGIEDTRQALIEAKRASVHPFCITIDRAEHRYLAHMYGPVNYVFIDDLSKLPARIPEIYRKLTT